MRQSRTRLYSLPPIGIGTSRVESLTSYTRRLASAHHITTADLVGREIAPALGIPDHRVREYLASALNRSTLSINGLSGTAKAWATAIGQLTGQSQLSALTLTRLEDVLTCRDGSAVGRGVCPDCIRAMDPAFVYDPLLFTFNVVDSCERHSLPLVTQCPSCQGDLRQLGSISLPGRCDHCLAWLGDIPSPAALDSSTGWARWVASSIGGLLAEPERTGAEPCDQSAAMETLIGQVGSGNTLAKAMRVSTGMVSTWRNGGSRPELRFWLSACAVGQVALQPLLLDCRLVGQAVPAPEGPASVRRLAKQHNWTKIKRSLVGRLRSQRHESLASFARRHGVTPKEIRLRYPNLAAELGARTSDAVAAGAQARLARLTDQIDAGAAVLRSTGVPRTRRNLEPLLEPGVQLRERALKDRWQDIVENGGSSA
jgi:hypothetical protein